MKKRTFFERLTGGIRMDDNMDDFVDEETTFPPKAKSITPKMVEKDEDERDWMEEEEGQLTVDVYQTPGDIVVQTMVAGVRPEDLQINITRDMITIKGKREEVRNISEDNYFTKELYWGTFSRTVLLPQEVEPEEAEATERHGLLTIKMPKIDKNRKSTLKVKSL
jgi:HSP20 family protein